MSGTSVQTVDTVPFSRSRQGNVLEVVMIGGNPHDCTQRPIGQAYIVTHAFAWLAFALLDMPISAELQATLAGVDDRRSHCRCLVLPDLVVNEHPSRALKG